MCKKKSFIYSVILILIFIIAPKITYSEEKLGKGVIIYEDENAAEAATEDAPAKDYKVKLGIIKRDVELEDAYQMQSNSKGFYVPIKTWGITAEKDDVVLVYEGEDDETTSKIKKYIDPPMPVGRVKKEDISYDIEDFKKSKSAFYVFPVTGYEDVDGVKGKKMEEPVQGHGYLQEKKDGWLLILILGDGEFWIEEKDLNFDYNSIEHETYDVDLN